MRNESEETARLVFSCFLEDEFRRKDKLYESDTTKIDAIMRSLSVVSLLDKEEFKSDTILIEAPEDDKASSDTRYKEDKSRKLNELVATLASFYRGRAEIICGNNAERRRDAFEDAVSSGATPMRQAR